MEVVEGWVLQEGGLERDGRAVLTELLPFQAFHTVNYKSHSTVDLLVTDCIRSSAQVFSSIIFTHVTYHQGSIQRFPKARLVHQHRIKFPANWLEPVDTWRWCSGCQACQVGSEGFENWLSARLLMISGVRDEFRWHWWKAETIFSCR